MRRIIASVNTTLDGYMEEPGGEAISTGSCRSSRMASQIARNCWGLRPTRSCWGGSPIRGSAGIGHPSQAPPSPRRERGLISGNVVRRIW